METGKRSTITLMMEDGVTMDRTVADDQTRLYLGWAVGSFRWDNADDVDIKDFSVREILPNL